MQIDIGNEARDKYKNPFLPATIIFGILSVCLIVVAIFLFIDNSKKYELLAQLQATIDMLKLTDSQAVAENGIEEDSGNPKGNGSYLILPNMGIKIPLSVDIIDKVDVVEVDDSSYRIDVKSIVEYRKQGYCGNGGSSAIGIISKNKVSIDTISVGGDSGKLKNKSQWSDNTIAKLRNEVMYPREYVTFENLDAVCRDLGEGGEKRSKEVAEEVQEINDAFEVALVNAVPID